MFYGIAFLLAFVESALDVGIYALLLFYTLLRAPHWCVGRPHNE